MARSAIQILAVLGLTFLSFGCGGNNPPPAPAPVESTPQAPPATTGGDDAPSVDPNAEARRNMQTLEEMVFFDYDESLIRSDQRQTLDQKVTVLRENPAYRLMIEGHADERGSTEYNLALGTRRALSIHDYLTGFGLDDQRFQTTSYGEERPLAQGQNETSWARNRRAAFRASGGPGGEGR